MQQRQTGRRNRKAEGEELERRFRASGATLRWRWDKEISPLAMAADNELSRLLHVAWEATEGEPVFLEALRVLAALGFNDLDGDPVKRLQAIRTRLMSAAALPAVEQELTEQAARGEPTSLRQACERAAASGVIDAPRLEAARQRLSRAYRERHQQSRISGNTGRKLLVGKVRPGSGARKGSGLVVRDPAWVADDQTTRRAVSCGELVVIEARDPDIQEHASLSLDQLARLVRDGECACRRLEELLAAKGLRAPEAEHGARSRPPRDFVRRRKAYDKGFERAAAKDPAFRAIADQACEGLCAHLELAGRADRAAICIAAGQGSEEGHRTLVLYEEIKKNLLADRDENQRLFAR